MNLKAGESDEEKNGVEDESTEKKVKRENQKKKKQERKRKKREALLKASLEKAEQEKKVANQLGHDLEINSALIKKNPEAKEKKRKHDAPITSSPVKKAKLANAESNGDPMDINQNMSEQGMKKKKKKNKRKAEHVNGNEDVDKVEEKVSNDLKEKSYPISMEDTDERPTNNGEVVFEAGVVESQKGMKNVEAGEADAGQKLKKKKKKSNKEMHRIACPIEVIPLWG